MGAGLGLVFYGGLHLTIHYLIRVRRPGMLLFPSALARTGTVLAGFSWLSAGDWSRFGAALLGFLAARTLFLARTGLPVREMRRGADA
jgi:F1F0 ATPase subunit 2